MKMTELFRLKVYLFTLNCFDMFVSETFSFSINVKLSVLVLVSNAKQTGVVGLCDGAG